MMNVTPYVPQLLGGLLITLQVSCGGMIIGLVVALFAAPLSLRGRAVTRWIASGYVNLIRGLPELLIIFMVYFGGTVVLSKVFGRYIEVNALTAGITALSVVSGAYLTEVLRSALMAIPNGQWEASQALGLRPWHTFLDVVFPQMMLRALPGIGNQWLITVKESALVSIVGLEELMRKSVIGAGATHDPLAFYLSAAGLYVCVTTVSSIALKALENRFQLGVG